MKVVYDTCLYIDLLRSGARLPLFQDRSHIRYLSPIVLMELRAGARKPKQKRAVDRLLEPYSQGGRVIHLDANIYYKAGEYLARLGAGKIHEFLSHDLLIALSARSIGATLFTGNKKHFSLLSDLIRLQVVYV